MSAENFESFEALACVDGDERFEFRANLGDAGKRIDRFLCEHLRQISRTQIQKSFACGYVSANGTAVAQKYIIRGDELVKFRQVPAVKPALHPVSMELAVIYEDSDIIVLNKPAGIIVHPGSGTNAPTLVDGLIHRCQLSSIGGKLRPGVVHRLDRDTSGVILFAKTNIAHLGLVKMFAERRLKKTYQAIVRGTFDKCFGEINLPIGRHRFLRTKMAVTETGRAALTKWNLIENIGSRFAHLKVDILTGRTHQIRVHLSHIGHQIVGDGTYGVGPIGEIPGVARTMLHARRIIFAHPISGKEITAQVLPPEDFLATLAKLGDVS